MQKTFGGVALSCHVRTSITLLVQAVSVRVCSDCVGYQACFNFAQAVDIDVSQMSLAKSCQESWEI